jgi:hypothetical protein
VAARQQSWEEAGQASVLTVGGAERERMATLSDDQGAQTMNRTLQQPEAISREMDTPEREAAFFYGLFLRGHTYQQLRSDIEVPPEVLVKWERAIAHDPSFRNIADQMLAYRRRVLAIFKSLVSAEGEAIH